MLLFVARTPFISVCFLHDEYKTDERYWKLNPDRAVPTLQDTAHNLTLTSPYSFHLSSFFWRIVTSDVDALNQSSVFISLHYF